MDNLLLHYRSWQGDFRRPLWSAWPIARVSLGMLLRRRLFWVLYAFGMLLFFMFFFGNFLLGWAETRIPEDAIQVGNFKAEPERLMKAIRQGLRVLNGSQETFGYFFVYQGAVVMVVLALAGAVLIGNDCTFRSLPFYLSKPLSRWHYLLGKGLAVGAVVNLLTTLPALVLYSQHTLDDWNYFLDPNYFQTTGTGPGPAGLPLLLGLFGFGLVLTVCLSIWLLAVAIWARRTVPLVMTWTTLFLFFRLLANILVDGLKYDARWRLLDLWNDLCLIGFACLGFDHEGIRPLPQPTFLEAGLVLAGVSVLCLIFLNLRTRAVDVVR